MKKTIYTVVIMMMLIVSCTFSNPTVSNIRVSQRENTKLVDILYDVTFTGGINVSVSCEISTNAGATFDVPGSSFTGDGYGAIVNTGTNRWIVWNAGADWDENYSDQMMVRITATIPRFTEIDSNNVMDNQSGLVWCEGFGGSPVAMTYDDLIWGNPQPSGYRLPTLEEFEALADSETDSGVPYGHPFTIQSGVYWTSSVYGMYHSPVDGYTLIYKGFSFYQREHSFPFEDPSSMVDFVPITTDDRAFSLWIIE